MFKPKKRQNVVGFKGQKSDVRFYFSQQCVPELKKNPECDTRGLKTTVRKSQRVINGFKAIISTGTRVNLINYIQLS